MTRRKLSEYRSKVIITNALNLEYVGWSINSEYDVDDQIKNIAGFSSYVVKVDQGVKGRFKSGLIKLDVEKRSIKSVIKQLQKKGYNSFIIEPFKAYDATEERYIVLSNDKLGSHASYSRSGGVNIENKSETIITVNVGENTDWKTLSEETGFSSEQLKKLEMVFNDQYMTMLEINPYVLLDGNIYLLDIAIEVDDAAGYFTDLWNELDFRRSSSRMLTDEEKVVGTLDEKSPASLKLEILNPNGSIFLLLSGGGASVVVADEVYNLGLGAQLANYGEYSGNPDAEETYLYARAIFNLALKSSAPKKVIFIGGAVANFTDIANTFAGIIKAIDELADDLRHQGVKIFVRRGGPRQEIGLAKINESLDKHGLLGAVYSPSEPLTKVVAETIRGITL